MCLVFLSRCNRALAVAGNQEQVVLRTALDRDYQDWLHANGLGTDHIVEFGAQSDEMTLSEMIVKNPDPILAVISKFGRAPVYVLWFSGRMGIREQVCEKRMVYIGTLKGKPWGYHPCNGY